jgi:hypothetical protein
VPPPPQDRSDPRREVEPPWVTYPDYGPGDGFWRQSGEPWWAHVWLPFWDSLNDREREAYLSRWSAPEQWALFFDREFNEWLDNVDDDDA